MNDKLKDCMDAIGALKDSAEKLNERCDSLAARKDATVVHHFIMHEGSSGSLKGGRVGEGKQHRIAIAHASHEGALEEAKRQMRHAGHHHTGLIEPVSSPKAKSAYG